MDRKQVCIYTNKIRRIFRLAVLEGEEFEKLVSNWFPGSHLGCLSMVTQYRTHRHECDNNS